MCIDVYFNVYCVYKLMCCINVYSEVSCNVYCVYLHGLCVFRWTVCIYVNVKFTGCINVYCNLY